MIQPLHGSMGALGVSSGAVFSPLSLTPTIWYDSSDVNTLWQNVGRTIPANADGNLVRVMDDKSGNGYNLIAASDAERFTFKTNAKNGLSVLRSDGANDMLTTDGASSLTNSTWFAVIKLTTSVNVFMLQNSSAAHAMSVVGGKIGEYNNGSSAYWQNVVYTDGQYGIIEIMVNVSVPSQTAMFNGASLTGAIGVSAAWASGRIQLRGVYVVYDFCEAMAFSGIMSSGDRTLVRNYLNTKWAIY